MTHYFSKENQSLRESTFRFSGYELDPEDRTLRKAGVLVPLPPKTFDALLFLVKRAGRLVTKQELMDALWPSLSVGEANLTNTIVSVRKALGRDAIRTVSKYGYRFELALTGEPNVARFTYERFARARELTAVRSLDSMRQARELLWICLAEDPSFAPAWTWLGRCSSFLGKFGSEPVSSIELAEAAMRRAFALDPDLSFAHQFYTYIQVDTGHASDAMIRLLNRLRIHPSEPESLGSLVQVFRFLGMLNESVAAHRTARELDPAAVTSIAHSLFLAGDYAETIETYSGRGAFYLDAAAWAGLGEYQRAAALLQERLNTLSLSPLIGALIKSLRATLEGDAVAAVRIMQAADASLQPEVLVYFARHYSHLGEPALAISAIKQAMEAGFVCPPETLRNDKWFHALRTHPEAAGLLSQVEQAVGQARCLHRTHAAAIRASQILA
jgi:DNA-binding winged helix-turn-helix (wHTH) protein